MDDMAGSARAWTPEEIRRFTFATGQPRPRDVAELHEALRRVGVDVPATEVAGRELGPATAEAVRAFQERAGLNPTGELTPETVARLKVELEHRHFIDSKARTSRIQEMLARTGRQLDPDEVRRRALGPSTEQALAAFKAAAGLPADTLVTTEVVDRLAAAALEARFSTNTQVAALQRTLQRAARIGHLEGTISADELRSRQLGPTSQAMIAEFQRKYGLPASGKLDSATFDRLQSVVASRGTPVRKLKPPAPTALAPVSRTLRLNMTNKHVGQLQQALAFLGHRVDQREFNTKTFGKTTREALLAYQRSQGLPPTGHADRATLNRLNRAVTTANPQPTPDFAYRIRGCVRNPMWQGLGGVRVQVRERVLRGEGAVLAERRTQPNGFFDVPYDPPRNTVDKQIKSPFHLEVVFLDAGGAELGRRVLFNPTLIAWANLTQGDQPYKGTSEFDVRMKLMAKALGAVPITSLEETADRHEVSQVAVETGLLQDDVMRLLLAHRVAATLADPLVGPAVCYAFIRQNLPPSLPSELLASTNEWELINVLVDRTASGLVFTDPDLAAAAFDNAVTENLVPIGVAAQRDAILARLGELRQRFALDKPILTGNGSLGALLDASAVPADRHVQVADAFLSHRGLGDDFWADVTARPADFGGADAVQDLRTTVEVGQISKNHIPTVEFVKNRIADPAETRINSARDLAKLSRDDWAALITANGGSVPEGTDGDTPEARVQTYAATLANQSERLFPSVALLATVARDNGHGLSHVTEVAQLIDEHPELDLRTHNVDTFVAEANIAVDEEVLTEARVLQRVHRLAPTAASGTALLDAGVHSSAQVVSLGKEGMVRELGKSGIDQRLALSMYGYAEFQYAQVLMRLAEYRNELHGADPQAIAKQTVSVEEQPLVGTIPDLETLFGPLDYCDCSQCQSVYSPAAYLADMLRFLQNHPAETAGKTVRDVLAERRPDLGNIKLNCANTQTALPYIDLVCEVLEAAVPAPNPAPDFSFQTTRTEAELRAFPEHVRPAAYDVLKDADYPMDTSFDLWQEEVRIFLGHLGVPRFELMEAFGPPQAPPGGNGAPTAAEVSVAGEYWGMSTHETGLVTQAAPAGQDAFWGFDTTRTEVPASEFLRAGRLSYDELLQVVETRWPSADGPPQPLQVDRPDETCSLDEMRLVNLTAARFDHLHRFLRLWRRTGWRPWQVDRAIRTHGVADSVLDGRALVALKGFKQVQDRLTLPFDTAIAWYNQIDTEPRTDPAQPDRPIDPLYIRLFQNPSVTDPVDPVFALPLSGAEDLTNHRATLSAALAVTDAELTELLARTTGKLTLDNLTLLYRHTTMARALGLPIIDLMVLLDLAAAQLPDPFATPQATLNLLDQLDWVRRSGFSLAELDYLLQFRADSPYGLRVQVLTQYIEALRETLRTNTAAAPDGQIAAQVATTFGLEAEQAIILLTTLKLDGKPLLTHLSDPRLTARTPDDQYQHPADEATFPAIYNTFRLLHKASLIVLRQKPTPRADLEWLLTKYRHLGGLDFSALPVSAPPAQPLFQSWLNLTRWLAVRSFYPEPEGVALRAVFDAAAAPGADLTAVRTAASRLTGWPAAQLTRLDTGQAAAYADVETYPRLRRCFGQLKRLGVDAALALAWADRDTDSGAQAAVAQQVRRAVKARYDEGAWADRVAPLQDELRERKRAALTGYLVEHSRRTEQSAVTVGGVQYANPRYWRDPNDLLRYFLIDCEMGACQLTSRIKQAISSVQMFVQRAFLNLEVPDVRVTAEERADAASLDSWKQWEWMKNYRVWEANRKVFLYPENWIEPELRDDKSPFFVELENELLQAELTSDNCETAVTHYLEKVHEVSDLAVAGIYHEVDDDNPYDALPPNINVLHVIGRTRSDPAAYYYRTFDLNYGTWTAWEKIDLDITGEHVVPVVYNRKLHLFWLVFAEKAQKVRKQPPAKPTDKPNDAPDPPRQLEIQLAWSVRRKGDWTARKTAPHKLIHPWERPRSSYNLKPRYKPRENQLWLDLYISTSQAFNNTLFYDPYKNTKAYLSAFRWDEAGRPWHSSSFVFDGRVVALKLKELRGQYHVLNAQGIASDDLVQTTSYQYVHDGFGDDGAAVVPLRSPYEIAPRLPLPDGMHYENTHLANNRAKPNGNKLNVLESAASTTLLEGAQDPFQAVFSQHTITLDTAAFGLSPFFYQDSARAFFVQPQWQQVIQGYGQVVQRVRYAFSSFYHPYTALFLRELGRSGMDGLLTRKIQQFPQQYYPGNMFAFTPTYRPTASSTVDPASERDVVDFSPNGACSIYNWEIFFHIPLLVATRLSQNQRFAEAMKWFHYIFDPTNIEAVGTPQRYWVTRPFFEQNADNYRKQRIEELLKNVEQNLDQVRAWKNNPFKPHLIARHRPVAYQKTVVMKYIDNLIAWGDQLFRRDTLESINEATLLYVLAQELLGRRPVKVQGRRPAERSYDELVADGALDPFGNKRIDVRFENYTPHPKQVVRTDSTAEPLPQIDLLYFGIPANDQLLGYWDVVADRLFKVRNCMNIEGVVRQLPLFEPPIDPAVLVKAAAAGVDIGSVLADTAVPAGLYRFRTLTAQALQLCSDVRVLGDRLLGVLERRDAEGLALLQAGNEVDLRRAILEVRRQQVDEAQASWDALDRNNAVLDQQITYHGGVPRMNAWEIAGVTAHALGLASELVATILNTVAGTAHLVPRIKAGASGFGGTPTLTVEFGGDNVGKSSTNYAALFQGLAGLLHQGGHMLETQGTYTRTYDSHQNELAVATAQKAQLEKQIEAARLRYLIAEKERDNTQLQIDQGTAISDYLKSKYTNAQLYDWMLGQLATIYFQSYQLAYDMAKRAEKCFQFELSAPTASFIQFGYWDSLKKGLLAGDKLAGDIHRMEKAYLETNRREFELTKHVSLAQVDPLALLALKQTGSCTVRLPEWLFDLDYPGHYRRRIRSVAISIPCVAGMYTNVNCTLSLTNNGIRLTDDVTAGYGDPLGAPDTRFARNPVPTASIATSTGVNDRGVFAVTFDDERYLPFEGAGAVSEWRLSMPQENNQFDLETVTDVVLDISMTAVAGSTQLADLAGQNLAAKLPGSGIQLFALDTEFSAEWYRFFQPDVGQDQELVFTLGIEHLPFFVRGRSAGKRVLVTAADLIVDPAVAGDFTAQLRTPGTAAANDAAITGDPAFGGLPHLHRDFPTVSGTPVAGEWGLKLRKADATDYRSLAPVDIQRAYLVVSFTIM
jgi:peptidoglycan hydrolase-like protein with peptidoglycan-binding domain